MLLWKLLFVADLIILGGYSVSIWTGRERLMPFDYVTALIGLVGTAGLCLYAFSLPPIAPGFWQIFVLPFAMAGAWEITQAVGKTRFNPGTAVGALLAFALVGLTCVAIYRLGGGSWL